MAPSGLSHQKQSEHEQEDYVVEQLVEVVATHEYVKERYGVGHVPVHYEPGVVVASLDFLAFAGEAELCLRLALDMHHL